MLKPPPQRRATLYDVLDVSRDAKLTDITRAYNRYRSELTRDDRPPDPKRETLLREAFETLSDPDRREAYDASLVAPDRRHRSRLRGMAIGAAGVAIAGVYLAFLRPEPERTVPIRTADDIARSASASIGQLRSIGMSGESVPVGVAFAIGEGMLVSSCSGVEPTSQLVVAIPPRTIPVRIDAVEKESGICRLVTEGATSRPLETSAERTKSGDLVYAAKVSDSGGLVLEQSRVKQVSFVPAGRVVEAGIAAANGAPLLDAQGRVIGIATGQGRHIAVPDGWIAAAREPFRERKPPASAAPAEAASPSPAGSPLVPKTIDDIPPAQREKLEKAHRPPPQVNEDWMK